MIKEFFVRQTVLTRLESGPLATYLPSLASALQVLGYAARTISRYLRSADRYGRWLEEAGTALADAGADELVAYRRSVDPRKGKGRRDFTKCEGLNRVVEILCPAGILNRARRTPVEDWLTAYRAHLQNVQGLSEATCKGCVQRARHLVAEFSRGGAPDWSVMTAEWVSNWVREQAARTVGKLQPVTTMRGVLRYLISQGAVEPALLQAIPSMPHRSKVGLPKRLSTEEWQIILSGCLAISSGSLRDRAIVLLLARLGIRAGEVRQLRLEDIDWQAGTITIRRGKSRRERQLPLPEDAGALMAEYIQRERPKTDHREVFLCVTTPHGPLKTSARISLATQRVLNRLGINRPKLGAHHLRHTVASQLVCRGATFKEIADILGHASLANTGIYAKLDEQALAQVSLPWPGGGR